jgi:K+/H+ antiporter YhaU regulatory subunit KhtT
MNHLSQDTENESPLYRGKKSKVGTLFIVGNGAIENGSSPLNEAIKTAYQNKFFHLNPLLLGSIPSLSCISATEKMLFDQLVLYINELIPAPLSNGPTSGFHHLLWNLNAHSYTFRKILGDSYKGYNETLCIRDSVWQNLKLLGITQESAACITTNWDDVLWENSQIKTLAHLHGRCHHPETLILPTETIFEKIVKMLLIYQKSNKFEEFSAQDSNEKECLELIRTIEHHYRENDMIDMMFEVENSFKEWLNTAKHIVIAGIAFNDYDHELMSTVANCANGNKCKVTIVNIARNEEEQRNKIDKVAGLFPYASEITFLNTWLCKKSLR